MDIWKNIKPFCKYEKGRYGLKYGFRKNSPKTRREIRKYGFDSSEIWSLDYTIMRWLSDTFGDFFTKCGSPDHWSDYDLDGNYIDFWNSKRDKEFYNKLHIYQTTREKAFQKYLDTFLHNTEEFKQIADFVAPRLRCLAKRAHGYPPVVCDTYEEWQQILIKMAEEFEQGICPDNFAKHFYSLWD